MTQSSENTSFGKLQGPLRPVYVPLSEPENKPVPQVEPRKVLRAIVKDFFRIKPAVYWTDLLVSSSIGWAAFTASLWLPGILLKASLILLATIALYRVAAFTHELVHVPKRRLPGFSYAWHFLCGIPILAPNFLYRQIHLDHHKRGHYSTHSDGEYIAFPKSAYWELGLFLLSGLIVPAMSLFRFAILAPASLLHPRVRNEVRTKASSMGVQTFFTRTLPKSKSQKSEWNFYETICSIVTITVLTAIACGWISIALIFHWYTMLAMIITMNAIRAVGCTHYYVHDANVPISLKEQIEDSINIDSSSIITLAICPVGTRYHCLHHIFPSMPYHNLQAAHRRLRAELPEDSFYHRLELNSIWTAWRFVWPSSNNRNSSFFDLQ